VLAAKDARVPSARYTMYRDSSSRRNRSIYLRRILHRIIILCTASADSIAKFSDLPVYKQIPVGDAPSSPGGN